jgi:hypothetical protein
MRGTWLVSMAVMVSACATARSRADIAFERADYVAAAEQYEVLAEREPKNGALRERRDVLIAA